MPWVLLGLVVVGAGLGAALGAGSAPDVPGVSGVTPTKWVANLLATTAASGSAHFSYTQVSASRSPEFSNRIAGSGELDFRSGNVTATEIDNQTQLTSGPSGLSHPMRSSVSMRFIGIRGTVYQSFAPAGFATLWAKMSWHRDARQDLGLALAGNAASALEELGGAQRVVGLREVGATNVGGVSTTRYEISTAPVCAPAHRATLVETQGPSSVWVDGRGRMVQITGSLRIGGHQPAAQQDLPAHAYPVAVTATLRLSAFGEPVRIHAPTILKTPYSSSVAIALRLNCSSK